jgi:predicted secreted protein
MLLQAKWTVILGSLIGLLLPMQIARAGDRAERHIIGFSPDGRYFAFEQYGAQDGSGFPYSEIFVIDTAKDAWLPGTPIRKLIKDETETAKVEDARKAAAAEAKDVLARLGIGKRGKILFSNTGETSVNGAQRVPVEPVGAEHLTALVLEEITLPSPEYCRNFEVPAKGMVLKMLTGGATNEIHRDKTLPESRRCPQAYAITDVVRFEEGGRPVYAVLIRMETLPGFEGPDSRYLAVTWHAP